MRPIKENHCKEHSMILHSIFQWTDGLIISYLPSQVFARNLCFLSSQTINVHPNPNAFRMYPKLPLFKWIEFWVSSISRATVCLILSKHVQPTKFSIKQQTTTCISVFASQEKNKEEIITCGISKQLYVGLQLSQLSLENMVSLPTFIRTEIVSGGSRHHWLDTCSFGTFWAGAGQLWHKDVTLHNALWWFIFGKGSGMVSCLAKRVRYQLLQGETVLKHLYA